ncbi:Hypothetical predicted protein [Lecanosticta acicola]|uniref:Uncharacterized protein n=1 Tax=Lecanosticta acicola TaxID=111012 RepID=A0AAI8Z0S2_9PEZI|nr:Hypothetical predicted protein [Lecanosticta acicola]
MSGHTTTTTMDTMDTIYSTIIVQRAPSTFQTSLLPTMTSTTSSSSSSSSDFMIKAAAATPEEKKTTTRLTESKTAAAPTITVFKTNTTQTSELARLQTEKHEWQHLHLALGLTIMALVLLIAFYVGVKAFCCYRRKKAKVVAGAAERAWPGGKERGGRVGKVAGRVAGFL